MKYLPFICIFISANTFAFIGDNPTDIDPAKSREPFCASSISMTVGPNQLHMLSSSNEKPNDSTTYELIEKKMFDAIGPECVSSSKSKLNSWDVSLKISDVCFNSCESDEVEKVFNKNNTKGAIGSKTFAEFKRSCISYCKLSDSFRTKLLQEKTEEAEQMKAYFYQLNKLQEATCADNKNVDNSSRIIQKAKEPSATTVPAKMDASSIEK